MSYEANTSLIKQIARHGKELPVISPDTINLIEALSNNEIAYTELATELEKFPSIAMKIVALANSSWSSPQTSVTSLPDACTRIGLNIVRSVSIALSISSVFDPTRCPEFDARTYWISALLNAESAYLCANNNPEINASTARLAGLLHNIGLLWLADKMPEDTAKAITDSQHNENISLANALIKQLQMDYCAIGGQLAAIMKLPDSIILTISTRMEDGLDSDDPLIRNHCLAKKLTSSVIMLSETNGSFEEADMLSSQEKQLAGLLPKVELMADALFQVS